MSKKNVIDRIEESGIVPVIRADSAEEAHRLIDAVVEGGIATIEVTLTVPDAPNLISKLVKTLGNEVVIGAGTVLDEEAAARCIDAGAQFIVSPGLDLAVVSLCNVNGVAAMPGALSPTEIIHAWKGGADVVKVFPASAMGGPSYLRALKAPFPDVKLMPTGGVSLSNIADFLTSGAVAVGVGGELVDVAAIREGRPESIRETARRYLEIIRSVRNHARV